MFPAWRALSSGPVLASVGPNGAIASFGAEEGATRGPGEEPASTGSIVLIRTLRLRRDPPLIHMDEVSLPRLDDCRLPPPRVIYPISAAAIPAETSATSATIAAVEVRLVPVERLTEYERRPTPRKQNDNRPEWFKHHAVAAS